MRLSLRQVLDRFGGGVHVPLIQRDYAHGRPDAKALRERFLEALRGALLDGADALDLDFIYGTRGEDDALLPLDGQQRLTTLFLLHWYLAARDGVADDFRAYATQEGAARFSYRVRPSSRRFFDALVTHDLVIDPAQEELSAIVRNQAWFFESWRLDPTVAACLATIDSIHQAFRDAPVTHARLIATDPAPITFQFLELSRFGLSDDLYIKMNARGKPLTALETFKANLEGHIGRICAEQQQSLEGALVSLQIYVAQRFDTAWADLFWARRQDGLDQDVQTMNAIRAVALLTTPRPADAEQHVAVSAQLDGLRTEQPLRFFDYLERGCLTAEFINAMTRLFDRWSDRMADEQPFLTSTAWYDERAVFARALRRAPRGREAFTMAWQVMFVAWCDWLLSDLPVAGIDAWMRVISNLAHNRIYNRPDELRSSLLASQELLKALANGADLLAVLADDPSMLASGFLKQQVREERIKAQLMSRGEWRPLIEKAETHGYFRGQIEFLLDFSGVLDRWLVAERCDWDDAEDAALRAAFARCYAQADAIFDAEGLRDFDQFVWERALLCEGDYLLQDRSNHGLLTSRGRALTWKRLLRSDLGNAEATAARAIVKAVLARVDPVDPVSALQARIDEGVRADADELRPGWRQCLVEQPQLIAYCTRRQLRFMWKGEQPIVFLLSKVQRNGMHKELFSAWLEASFTARIAAGEFAPINVCHACEECFDDTWYGFHASHDYETRTQLSVFHYIDKLQIYVPKVLQSAGEPADIWVEFANVEGEVERLLRATAAALNEAP